MAIGDKINPALGAVNYTPYLQGAIAGAQGIGQGLAGLGQGIGEGIKQYQQNKLISGQQIAKFEGAVQADPSIIQNAPPNIAKIIQKLQKDGSLPLKDAAQVGAYVDSVNAAREQQQTMQIRAAQLAELEAARRGRAGLSAAFSPGAPLADTSPQGRASYALSQGAPPGDVLNAMKALAPAEQPQGRIITAAEFAQYRQAGVDVDAVPLPDGTYLARKVSNFAPAPSTTVNLGNNIKQSAFTARQKQRIEEIEPMLASRENVLAMDALINAIDEKGQVITGRLANLELGAKSLLNATGLTNFEDVAATQEYLGNSVNLVGQIIRQFGSGTGLSDADREFAQKAAAGDITMDRRALQRLVSIAKKVMEKRVELFNSGVKSAFRGDTDDDKSALEALLIPEESYRFAASPVQNKPASIQEMSTEQLEARRQELLRRAGRQ